MNLQVMLLPLVYFLMLFVPEIPREKSYIDENIAKCHATTQLFAGFGNDPSFVNFHKDPLPMDFQNKTGKMITYPVAGGKDASAYFVKSRRPSDEYLLVFHEWYGLNAYVKNESEKFAERFNEMNVLALDLYDGQVAETSEAARELMQQVSTERALSIIEGAEDFAGENAKIFTVGWCFGGGWSLQAAIELRGQAQGAIMFYGMPEQDASRLDKLECDVLGIFAEQDQWITPEVVSRFKEKMSQTNNKLILKTYDADHGFANPGNPDFDQNTATEAYREMFDFISSRR